MIEYPDALAEHLAGPVTTLCYCWRVVLTDGTVLGFTDHDRALSFNNTNFEPQSGFSASEARRSLGISADTMDIEGALSSKTISDDDIEAGLYDGARVETWLTNWNTPQDCALLQAYTIGKISRADGVFHAELLGLAGEYDEPRGRCYRRLCSARLGDTRCGVDLQDPAFRASAIVTDIPAANAFVVSGLDAVAAGWFANGELTWTGSQNAGLTQRITEHRIVSGAVRIVVEEPPASVATVGDTFDAVAGCDKTFATCKTKFSNQLSFRGFPHLPGTDAAYNYASGGQVFNGKPLVP